MKETLFVGSGVALVTPFHDNGSVNFAKLGELLEYHVANSTDAIIICGTTGESAAMSDEEHKAVIKFAVEKINKRIPVIAGTGSNDTAYGISLSKYAEQAGADGLLLVTPYYNKATQKGLIAHFTAIADAVNIPIILYNVPSRTGVNIQPKTLKELSKHKNIVGIKEASGDIAQVAEMAMLCPDIAIYSGNDDMIVPTMSLGGKGVISVVAHLAPKQTHDIVMEYLNGNTKKSLELQLEMYDLVKSLFIEVNPIPVKTALNMMGLGVGPLRLPLCEMGEENKEILKNAMNKYGIKTV